MIKKQKMVQHLKYPQGNDVTQMMTAMMMYHRKKTVKGSTVKTTKKKIILKMTPTKTT